MSFYDIFVIKTFSFLKFVENENEHNNVWSLSFNFVLFFLNSSAIFYSSKILSVDIVALTIVWMICRVCCSLVIMQYVKNIEWHFLVFELSENWDERCLAVVVFSALHAFYRAHQSSFFFRSSSWFFLCLVWKWLTNCRKMHVIIGPSVVVLVVIFFLWSCSHSLPTVLTTVLWSTRRSMCMRTFVVRIVARKCWAEEETKTKQNAHTGEMFWNPSWVFES